MIPKDQEQGRPTGISQYYQCLLYTDAKESLLLTLTGTLLLVRPGDSFRTRGADGYMVLVTMNRSEQVPLSPKSAHLASHSWWSQRVPPTGWRTVQPGQSQSFLTS